MRRKALELRASAERHPGFSLTELVVAVAIAMVLLAVGLPAFVRFYHSYQLTNAATQVRDYLRLARYEAIRQNKLVDLQIQPSASYPGMTSLTVVIPTSSGSSVATNMTTLLGTNGNLVGTAPGGSTVTSSIGSLTAVTIMPTALIVFDQRGAVKPPTSVNVFFLNSALAPDAGYRAVLLLPAGSIQMWTGDGAGNWQQTQ
jgi:type IV fimbrial biogenesis protein FimT